MVYHGHIQNGQIVLNSGALLPEGAIVTIHIDARSQHASSDEEPTTLYERLKDVVGSAKGLPPDLAAEHDHYLHGQPKR